jgi:hypothetical protein
MPAVQITSGELTVDRNVSAKAAGPRFSSTQMSDSGSMAPRMERRPSVVSAPSDAASAWKDCARCAAPSSRAMPPQLEPP